MRFLSDEPCGVGGRRVAMFTGRLVRLASRFRSVLVLSLLTWLSFTPAAPAAERDEEKSVLLIYQESRLLPAVTLADQEIHARQLQRWGISEGRLPPGSVVQYREPTAWQRYKWYIAGGLAVIGLQALLIIGLLGQRRQRVRAQRVLYERLRFEALVSELSANFAHLAPNQVDQGIEWALSRILEALGLDRGSLLEFTTNPRLVRIIHSSTVAGVAPLPAIVEADRLSWTIAELRRGRVVRFSRLDELPADGGQDREGYLAFGTRSLAAIPLVVGGSVVGALGLSVVRAERTWSDDLVERLRLLGEILGNALARRQAESAVVESEERFHLLTDTAPLMVWMSGPDGGCTYFNTGWLDFTGRRLEDELGDGWAEGVHPDDRQPCLDGYGRAFDARRPFVLEYRLRRSDGEYRWILDHGVPRHGADGSFSGYIGSCVDITDRKRAEEDLRKSEATARAFLDAAGQGVLIADGRGRITRVNPKTEEMFGYKQDELVGQRVELLLPERLRSIHVDHRASYLSQPRVRPMGPGLDLAGRRKDGTEFPVEISLSYVTTEQGIRVLAFITSITERKRAEDEARRHREELAHALRVTTMGELAASLAHEINQPLAAILSNAQAAHRVLQGGHPERGEIEETLTDIAEDAKRASQVIRRLRALFKKESAKRDVVDLNTLITEATDLVRRDVDRNGIAITWSLAPGLPQVRGDTVQLQQVILNLLVNAIEATAGTERRELTIETTEREPGIVEVSVRDSGVGVKEADIERIFDPFFTTKVEGIGMGLSISRSIVAAHGGRIWAMRNDDGGITVHIEVPCEENDGPRA